MRNSKKDTDIKNRLLDSVGEGKGGMIWETNTETCILFSSVQSLSCVRLFATPWIAARWASLSITNSRSSLRLASIESVMPSSHLILGHPPLLLPPNPSQHQSLFQWVSSSHEVAKYWSFSFCIIPSKEIPGLISFRMDWLDLLAVQGTVQSLLQHHSSKPLILWPSAFFKYYISIQSIQLYHWI